mmetsp:Transcript_38862/g.28746  ORF Transcript_38862/g.28746 Transcript_38862/m.28746 type:complete len:116 (+) Transcript_38862:223-570(+)
MSVVVDTGSDWLALKSVDCSNCMINSYDYEASTTYVPESTVELIYSTGVITGKTGRDSFSLDSLGDTGAESILFVAADYFSIMTENVGGVVGFARSTSDDSQFDSGDLLYEKLYE